MVIHSGRYYLKQTKNDGVEYLTNNICFNIFRETRITVCINFVFNIWGRLSKYTYNIKAIAIFVCVSLREEMTRDISLSGGI